MGEEARALRLTVAVDIIPREGVVRRTNETMSRSLAGVGTWIHQVAGKTAPRLGRYMLGKACAQVRKRVDRPEGEGGT